MPTSAESAFDLRTARRKAGKSAPDLATVIDVHPTTVFRRERRERQPGPGEVTSRSAALGVDRALVSEFFLIGLEPVRSDGYPGKALRIRNEPERLRVSWPAPSECHPTRSTTGRTGRARIPAARSGFLLRSYICAAAGDGSLHGPSILHKRAIAENCAVTRRPARTRGTTGSTTTPMRIPLSLPSSPSR